MECRVGLLIGCVVVALSAVACADVQDNPAHDEVADQANSDTSNDKSGGDDMKVDFDPRVIVETPGGSSEDDESSEDDGSSGDDETSEDDEPSEDGEPSEDDGDSADGPGYCDLDSSPGTCPHSQGFWKNHVEQWPISTTDDCSGGDATGCLCGMTWEEVLNTPPVGGDPWVILARQWVAAALNTENKACNGESEEYLLNGEQLLSSCTISSEDKDWALEIAGRLDLFNNGKLMSDCSS